MIQLSLEFFSKYKDQSTFDQIYIINWEDIQNKLERKINYQNSYLAYKSLLLFNKFAKNFLLIATMFLFLDNSLIQNI